MSTPGSWRQVLLAGVGLAAGCAAAGARSGWGTHCGPDGQDCNTARYRSERQFERATQSGLAGSAWCPADCELLTPKANGHPDCDCSGVDRERTGAWDLCRTKYSVRAAGQPPTAAPGIPCGGCTCEPEETCVDYTSFSGPAKACVIPCDNRQPDPGCPDGYVCPAAVYDGPNGACVIADRTPPG